jgi:hypothetical protein
MSWWRAIGRAFRAASAWLDRHRRLCLAVVAVWLLAVLFLRARGQAFWHDEVYTVLLAQLPLSTIWRAYLDAADLAPPLNTMLTHVSQWIRGPSEVVSRLPPMIGFVAAAILLSVAVRRRTNAVAALLPPLIFFLTPAWDYAIEARGYALSLFWFALALFAWTEASRGRRPALHWTLMGVALAGAVWTHYFAALAALVVVAGELTRQTARRTFVAAPWIACAGAALAAMPLLPLIRIAASQRTVFWARVSSIELGVVYRFAFGSLRTHQVEMYVLASTAAIELIRRLLRRSWPRHLDAHDVVAAIVCLALPAAGAVAGYWTGVLTDRYVTFTAAGIAFSAPLLVWMLTPACGLGEWIALVVLAVPAVGMSQKILIHPPVAHQRIDDRPLLREWLRSDESIVVAGGVDFLGLWYSIPAAQRSRVVHVADVDSELHFEGSNTVERGYLALSRWTPVQVVRVKALARARRPFLLYAYEVPWQQRGLADAGATLVELSREASDSGVLYRVTVPE